MAITVAGHQGGKQWRRRRRVQRQQRPWLPAITEIESFDTLTLGALPTTTAIIDAGTNGTGNWDVVAGSLVVDGLNSARLNETASSIWDRTIDFAWLTSVASYTATVRYNTLPAADVPLMAAKRLGVQVAQFRLRSTGVFQLCDAATLGGNSYTPAANTIYQIIWVLDTSAGVQNAYIYDQSGLRLLATLTHTTNTNGPGGVSRLVFGSNSAAGSAIILDFDRVGYAIGQEIYPIVTPDLIETLYSQYGSFF